MDIKPIKNSRDYRRALKEIDRLMDARANTPQGDRLDVLVTLVEAWEGKHWPIDVPDPIDAICLPWSSEVYHDVTSSHSSAVGHELLKSLITREPSLCQ